MKKKPQPKKKAKKTAAVTDSATAIVQMEWEMVTSPTGVRSWRVEDKLVTEGLEISDDATLDDVVGKLRDIHGIHQAMTLVLADIFTWARRTGNTEEIAKVLEQMEFDLLTVKKSLDVADVPRQLRNPKLKAEHYYVVSRCTYEDMLRWLDMAVQFNLTAGELKKSMEAGRPLTSEQIRELSGQGAGLSNYTKLLSFWESWKKKVGGEEAILSWPDPVLSVWVNNMRPVRDLVDRAEKRLAQ